MLLEMFSLHVSTLLLSLSILVLILILQTLRVQKTCYTIRQRQRSMVDAISCRCMSCSNEHYSYSAVMFHRCGMPMTDHNSSNTPSLTNHDGSRKRSVSFSSLLELLQLLSSTNFSHLRHWTCISELNCQIIIRAKTYTTAAWMSYWYQSYKMASHYAKRIFVNTYPLVITSLSVFSLIVHVFTLELVVRSLILLILSSFAYIYKNDAG